MRQALRIVILSEDFAPARRSKTAVEGSLQSHPRPEAVQGILTNRKFSTA